MQITRVYAVPVRVPTRRPLRSALGAQETCEFAIVAVEADDGTQGIGEISLIWHGNGARLAADVNDLVAPRLVGADPFALTQAMSAVDDVFRFGRHSLTARAAVEMALLDLQGKLCGRRVVDLLGGVCVPRLPLSMSLSIAELPDLLGQARDYIAAGIRAVKVKGGRDLEYLEAAVSALRREFGAELAIRVDLNMSCATAAEALRIARRLERFDIVALEQPLPPADLSGHSWLRHKTDIPIMLDESVWSIEDCWQAVRERAADFVNVYVSEAGGLRAAGQLGALCRLAGVGIAVGSMPELGTGTAAAIHFAFSQPGLSMPSDLAGFCYYDDDVVSHDLRVEDGYVYAPRSAGLGVELDENRLRHYAAPCPARRAGA
jgi:L-alanine-DL-glutamate epimerase-like enolase superfamily enzyme